MKLIDVIKNIKEAQHDARNSDVDGSEKTEQTLLWVLSLLEDAKVDEYQPGDVVHLKSGSPKMTIVVVGNEGCRVIWCAYGTDKVQDQVIPFAALRKHT